MSVDMKHKRTSPKHEKEHPKIRTVILHNVLITLLIMGVSTIMAQAFFITVGTLPVLQLSMCWQSCW